MSLLRDFEKKIEKVFEGFFTKSFRSGIHPIELAKKLAREMEEHKTVSIAKTYVPNQYTIHLSKQDKQKLASFEQALTRELQDFLINQAAKEGLSLLSRPQITIEAKETLKLGEIEVEGKLDDTLLEEAEQKESQMRPLLEGTQIISEEEKQQLLKQAAPAKIEPATLTVLSKPRRNYPLVKKVITIGRLETNDIALEDPNVSRVHAEIRWEAGGFYLIDLGSTNGTFIKNRRISKHKMKDGETISMGETSLKFRSV